MFFLVLLYEWKITTFMKQKETRIHTPLKIYMKRSVGIKTFIAKP